VGKKFLVIFSAGIVCVFLLFFGVCCMESAGGKGGEKITPEITLSSGICIKLPVFIEEFEKAGYYRGEKNGDVPAHATKEYILKDKENHELKVVVYNPYDVSAPLGMLPVTTVYGEENSCMQLGDCEIGTDMTRLENAPDFTENPMKIRVGDYSMYIVFDKNKKIMSFMCSYLGKGWWQ